MYFRVFVCKEEIPGSRFRTENSFSMLEKPLHLGTGRQNFPEGGVND